MTVQRFQHPSRERKVLNRGRDIIIPVNVSSASPRLLRQCQSRFPLCDRLPRPKRALAVLRGPPITDFARDFPRLFFVRLDLGT